MGCNRLQRLRLSGSIRLRNSAEGNGNTLASDVQGAGRGRSQRHSRKRVRHQWRTSTPMPGRLPHSELWKGSDRRTFWESTILRNRQLDADSGIGALWPSPEMLNDFVVYQY